MFQFSRFASGHYVFMTRYLSYDRWVSPFGNSRIKVSLHTPRDLSHATTSFIASYCLGIHRMRLFTWPYNPNMSDLCESIQSFHCLHSLTMTIASLRVLLLCHKDQRTLSLYFSAWENAFLCSLSVKYRFFLIFSLYLQHTICCYKDVSSFEWVVYLLSFLRTCF